MKVLVSDALSPEGIEILRREPDIEVDVRTKLSPEELVKSIKDFSALIVKSGTKVTKEVIEAADRLKVIARAGVGLDNIDVESASERGVIVMSAPGGSTIAATEHTMTLILALSRNIPQASQSLKDKKWERKKFMGVEIYDKVLGVIGVGRIGRAVIKRAQAFGMKVIAHDPFVPGWRAKKLGVELVDLQSLLRQADYITLHVPLTSDTRHMIGASEFAKMKPGVRIINCARGGVVDEKALCKAIKDGRVAGAALDVFEEEPPFKSVLLELPEVVVTPHLGAATEEAQIKVAVDTANQVIDALKDRGVRNAVNLPLVRPEEQEVLEPYLRLSEKLGCLQAQLTKGEIRSVRVNYSGPTLSRDTAPLTVALLKGLLEPLLPEMINYVNAPIIAKKRGIRVIEGKSKEAQDFANLITVDLEVDGARSTVAGALFGKNDPRIVKLNEYRVNTSPQGYILICSHQARPGIVGKIGTIFGNNNINISQMTLGREETGKRETTVLNLDASPPQEVIDQIGEISEMLQVRLVKL